MSESVVNVQWKEQFDTLLKNTDKLVFVDFWAEWCGPCRMLGPALHEVASKNADSVLVAKIDVDDPQNQALAMEFQVRSIPQVTIFKGGSKVDQFVGAIPPDMIMQYVDKHK